MIVTYDELRAWVSAGESLTVEFKGESRERLNDTDLVEAVACMAKAPANTGVAPQFYLRP